MKAKSVEPVNLPNGFYSADWIGYHMTVRYAEQAAISVEVDQGMRGKVELLTVRVIDGWLYTVDEQEQNEKEQDPKEPHLAIKRTTPDKGCLSIVVGQMYQAHINYGPEFLFKTEDEASPHALELLNKILPPLS